MIVPSDDTIATAKGELEVHAIHHASLMFTLNDRCVLVDPAPMPGRPEAASAAVFKQLPTPDVIVFTHDHFDHFNLATLEHAAGPKTEIVAPRQVCDAIPQPLKARTRIMGNGDRAVVCCIPMEAVPMYNTTPERMQFHPNGVGNGYIFMFGGKRIYVAGDTEEIAENAHLIDIDAAFLPMNLPYTMAVDAAAHWVRSFRPRVVYPYHFGNPDGTFSDLAAFKSDVGEASEVRILKWY